jgi:hypothetical protein
MICMSINAERISRPTPGLPGMEGSRSQTGRINDTNRATRAIVVKARLGLREVRSSNPYRPATPNDPPRQAARIGKGINGRNAVGTGKIALATAATSRLTMVAPIPASRPANTNDPMGRGGDLSWICLPFSVCYLW